VSDFDERDPFPEASVPQEDASREAPSTADAGELAAPVAGVPEPQTTAPPDIPPSEAPTLPMIPVEQLRFRAEAAPAPSDAPPPAAPEPPRPAPLARPSGPAAMHGAAGAAGAPAPPAAPATAGVAAVAAPAPPIRDLLDRRQPLYRECQGYRLRLDPPDLARLRELPGGRGKSDDEIGEAFFDGQAERLAASIAGDVPTPCEIRVVVDPYSRQAFLALENRIRGILSF
jgi:hypothetical protein